MKTPKETTVKLIGKDGQVLFQGSATITKVTPPATTKRVIRLTEKDKRFIKECGILIN